MKVKLIRDGVLVGNHTHVKDDVVDVHETRALDLVEHGSAELAEAVSVTLEGVEALRHKVALLPK